MPVPRILVAEGIDERLDEELRGALTRGAQSNHFSLLFGISTEEIVTTHQETDVVLVDVTTFSHLVADYRFYANERLVLATFDPAAIVSVTLAPEDTLPVRYVLALRPLNHLECLFGCILAHLDHGFSGDVGERLLNQDRLIRTEESLHSSRERPRFQELVTAFYNARKLETPEDFAVGVGSVGDHLSSVLEELMMNAIWDAHPVLRDVDRKANVELPSRIEVELLFDGVFMGVAVTDNYGNAPLSAIAKPIRYAMGLRDPVLVDDTKAGAGLGLPMILKQVSLLTFHVAHGRLTRVLAMLCINQSRKQTQSYPRTVLFFEGTTLP